MSLQQYLGKVEEIQVLNERFLWVQIELLKPHRLEFTAGQYILLDIPGHEHKRSYSIASPPIQDHQVDLLLDTRPNGIGSQYFKQLQVGDEVGFRAPVGVFMDMHKPEEKQLVFLATGSGISPIRSIILYLLQHKHDTRDIFLHWGMRQVEDVFWQDEFLLLAQSFPNFHFELVLSEPPPVWPLRTGHVTLALSDYADTASIGFYLCGNHLMIGSAKTILTVKGVEPQKIHWEEFY